MRVFLLLLLSLFFTPSLSAQEDEPGSLELGEWTIRPIFAFQGWGTYTMGQEEYNASSGNFDPVDNRLNFMLRRFRWGSTVKVGDRLFIKFLGALDFVGSDQRSGTVGGVNNGGFPVAQVWDLYARYRISKNSEALHVIGGYFRPPMSRESMSGALGVSSFEKGFNQWYIRQHLVGTGPGATGGVYLGGLHSFSDGLHVDYRGGVFNPQNNSISAGVRAAPLLVSRLNFMFGDPEKKNWTYGLAGANTFGKRRGASVALVGSTEGATGAAPNGISHVGVDGVVSLGQWHAEGEWHRMVRNADGVRTNIDNESVTYLFRTGYNFDVTPADSDQPRYLEPSLMVYGFNGATMQGEYLTVVGTNFFGGEETVVDVGVNYHLVPGRIRLGLHYVSSSGNRGELPADGRLSWHHMQSGIGGIQRGDYVGMEVIFAY